VVTLLAFVRRFPSPLRTRRTAAWAAVVVALTIALARVPLFGVLGYEFALVMAVIGSVVGVDLGGAWIRRQRRSENRPGVVPLMMSAVVAPLAIMVLPLAAIAVRTLWVRACDPRFGGWAYVVLTLASTGLAAVSGAAFTLVVGRRRWLTPMVPYLALLVVAGLGVLRFWQSPPVFTYNPIVGYFPGNLYDEDIRLEMPLLWARLEQLAFLIAVTSAVAARYDRDRLSLGWRGPIAWRPASLAVLAAVAAIGLRWSSGSLGYAIDDDDIAQALGGVRRTPHFVIYYDNTPQIAADIDLIAADHELRLAQVCRSIGVDPAALGEIHSFYFASADRKAHLMGARHVEMAKPWRREIYLTHDDFPHGSLRHEIAHVVAGQFGDPWFHVAARRVLGVPLFVNPGLIEGLAVALDWPGGSRSMTPHQSMRAMEILGFAPNPSDVFSVRFMTLSSARGYTAAGSFMRFLLDQYGAAAVRAVYSSGGDFTAAFGRTQSQLVDEWRAMLSTVAVPAADLEAARERFRGGSVFDRPCPHAIAAREAAASRRLDRGDRRGAIASLRHVCRDAPDEPTYSLTLAAVLAAGTDASDTREARAIYARWTQPGVDAAIASIALEGLARLDARVGDYRGATDHITTALALPLDDDRRRPFEALYRALTSEAVNGAFLRGYFFGDGDHLAWALVAKTIDPSDAFARYLLGLQLIEHQFPRLAAPVLATALAIGLPSPRFTRAAARRLLVAAWRADDDHALTTAIDTLETTGVEVDRLLAADWRQRRAGWLGAHRPLRNFQRSPLHSSTS
jgi:hypothetical protein